jgi:hypothetical protein
MPPETSSGGTSGARPTLRFRHDGTFTIVQFTDVHWSNGGASDLASRALMEQVLDHEAPDLVVLTGDIIEGWEAVDPTEAYRQVVRPMDERRIPWAAVFGNHDDEGSASREDLVAAQQESPGCLTEAGPADVTGVGNYVVRIARADRDGLGAVLYCLDSNAYDPVDGGRYAWIAHDQIGWYRDTAGRLARDLAAEGGPAPLPALAFFHIPLPEYDDVWRRQICRGHRNEPVCAPVLNSGFFVALLEAGDVMGTFVGHDHLNDFEGELRGIRLCYGRATGYAPYGLEGFRHGARVIRLYEGERRFDTWVRLDDGSLLDPAPAHEPGAD